MLRVVKEASGEREGSQAFLCDKSTSHNARHHRHPHQQPLLETLLRPPAFSRRILPEDFSEALLERETKTECKGLMAGHLMHSVTCIQMWKNPQVCTLPKNAPFKKKKKPYSIRWIPFDKRSLSLKKAKSCRDIQCWLWLSPPTRSYVEISIQVGKQKKTP